MSTIELRDHIALEIFIKLYLEGRIEDRIDASYDIAEQFILRRYVRYPELLNLPSKFRRCINGRRNHKYVNDICIRCDISRSDVVQEQNLVRARRYRESSNIVEFGHKANAS